MELAFPLVLGVVFVVNALKSVADKNISAVMGWSASLIMLGACVQLMAAK